MSPLDPYRKAQRDPQPPATNFTHAGDAPAAATPREAIARALWLKEISHGNAKHWKSSFAWYETEIAQVDRTAADNSAIGGCVRRAEKILRLLDAAGLTTSLIA